MKEILSVKNISQKYQADNGEILAIEDISFSVNEGEIISIVGPSGSGKSTLLSMISGLLKPTGGEIILDGEKIESVSKKVGYMLQKDYLLEWRTIHSNVMFGLEIQENVNENTKKLVDRLLLAYGLYEFKDKHPSQLSGGMRQRAALIRTLAINPMVLLLDEAFSALDYQTRMVVTEDVYKILKEEHKTTIMVTHDISEAISMADKVIVLTDRPSKIRAMHSIEFESANSPLQRRNDPLFRQYYNEIWRELDVNI